MQTLSYKRQDATTQQLEFGHQLRFEKKTNVMAVREFIRTALQRTVIRIGEHLSASNIARLDRVINYLEVGRWFRANGYSVRNMPRLADHHDLYAAIADKIKDEVVLYLEFGVWEGASLRAWSCLLRNPFASLHEFDSFEGLPESWDTRPKGFFDVHDHLPRFDDPRVCLHKGWFQDTLPGFVLPKHERLVLNLDADLYSSTKFVLDTLQDAMQPGRRVRSIPLSLARTQGIQRLPRDEPDAVPLPRRRPVQRRTPCL